MEKPSRKKNSNPSKKKPYNEFARYSGLAFQMAAVIVLGALLAQFVGGKLEGQVSDLVKVAIILLFVIAAIYLGIKDFIFPK